MEKSWIEQLRDELGEEVVLISQKGHEHWGFITGNVYRIVRHKVHGRYGFLGIFDIGEHHWGPAANYGNNWQFEKAAVNLENK